MVVYEQVFFVEMICDETKCIFIILLILSTTERPCLCWWKHQQAGRNNGFRLYESGL